MEKSQLKILNLPIKNHEYNIYIGENLDKYFGDFLHKQNFSQKCMVITDENVGSIYGEKYLQILRENNFVPLLVKVPSGENTKSLEIAQVLYTKAIEHGLDRKSPIFALGGGVVGDLAGFIAATFMRGVPFIQIPTSLLAMVDSSVGGKVAINHSLGKNLIGAFYQPKGVFIDINFLQTLPKREFATGMAEVIKYGYIDDESFLDYLLKYRDEILNLDRDKLIYIIEKCCRIKGNIVLKDEKENSIRGLLNFGHTLAHSIETETKYEQYNHGEAVAIGMVCAGYISHYKNHYPLSQIKKMRDLLQIYYLPIFANNLSIEKLYSHLYADKKAIDGVINWILLNEKGKIYIDNNVLEEMVKKSIQQVIS